MLDKLGLPSGMVDFVASDQIVANTSARPGDQFYVRAGQGGAAKPPWPWPTASPAS